MRKRLPQPDALLVEQEKIVQYLLNLKHPDGAWKAMFFSRFGFEAVAWSILANTLCAHGRERDVVEQEETAFGSSSWSSAALKHPMDAIRASAVSGWPKAASRLDW